MLGILSLAVCAPLGIAAWIMGNRDLAEMAAGRMDPSGRDIANIGRILGIIGACIFGVQIVVGIIWGLYFLLIVAGAAVRGAPM